MTADTALVVQGSLTVPAGLRRMAPPAPGKRGVPVRGDRLLNPPWMPMNSGLVVTGDAEDGCALRWFVGVITATTKRASPDRPLGLAGDRRAGRPLGLAACGMW